MDGEGKNTPADPIETLRENLAEKYQNLITRADQLLEAFTRVPPLIVVNTDGENRTVTVADEEVAGKVTDMIKLVTAVHKAAETARVGEKEPFLASERAVDGWFKGRLTNKLDDIKRELTKSLNGWQQHRIDEQRRLAREEEKRKADEAALLAAAAEATGNDQTMTAAAVAENESLEAGKVADAKPSELGQVRGDYGGLGTVQMRWKGYVDDRQKIDLEKLRAHFNTADIEKALNSAVRAGLRECAGARIVQEVNTMVR